MYPFYYPFARTFCYNQFPSYSYQLSNLSQFYAFSHQITLEQKNERNQEVHTSYSVNVSGLQQKVCSVTPVSPTSQKDFHHSNEDFQKTQTIQKRIQKNDGLQFKVKAQTQRIDHSQRRRYINKNFQSNIINKVFSFLWSQDKSKLFVTKILKDKNKVSLYFQYMKIIRKYCKRYINKEYLQNLCNYQPQHIAYRIVARHLEKLILFSMEELSQTIRKLIYIYLKDVCSLSILTSRKMRVGIWKDHFEKSRNIFQYLFQGLSAAEYDERMTQSYDKIYANPKSLKMD